MGNLATGRLLEKTVVHCAAAHMPVIQAIKLSPREKYPLMMWMIIRVVFGCWMISCDFYMVGRKHVGDVRPTNG